MKIELWQIWIKPGYGNRRTRYLMPLDLRIYVVYLIRYISRYG